MAAFLDPLVEGPAHPVRLFNRRTGRIIASHVVPAFDSGHRRRGLLGRESMDEGEALIIAPCWAIHTWFMKMALDTAFVAKDGRVVAVRPHLKPWRMAMAFPAYCVVEMAAGRLQQTDTKVGDRLGLE